VHAFALGREVDGAVDLGGDQLLVLAVADPMAFWTPPTPARESASGTSEREA